MGVTLDAYFCELEPYYLGEVSRTYLLGESSIEENLLLESGGEEFIELKKLSENLVEIGSHHQHDDNIFERETKRKTEEIEGETEVLVQLDREEALTLLRETEVVVQSDREALSSLKLPISTPLTEE